MRTIEAISISLLTKSTKQLRRTKHACADKAFGEQALLYIYMRRPQEVRGITPEAFLKQRIPIVDIPLSLDLRKLAISLKAVAEAVKPKMMPGKIRTNLRNIRYIHGHRCCRCHPTEDR